MSQAPLHVALVFGLWLTCAHVHIDRSDLLPVKMTSVTEIGPVCLPIGDPACILLPSTLAWEFDPGPSCLPHTLAPPVPDGAYVKNGDRGSAFTL